MRLTLSRDAKPNAYTHIAPIKTHIDVSRILRARPLGATLFSTTPHAIADYDEHIKRIQKMTMRHATRKAHTTVRCGLVVALAAVFASCGTSVEGLCSQAVSVPSFSIKFLQGLNNFSENQYEDLRLDTQSARQTVALVLELYPQDPNVVAVLEKIKSFESAMQTTQWDVSLALGNSQAVQSAAVLGSAQTLEEANQIDAYVIALCGLPSTFVPNQEPVATLPMPWIPSPTDTEPDSELLDSQSEMYALGEMVGTLFQLTLSRDQVLCVGEALSGVVDTSDATSNSAQYQSQFQNAFDVCGIPFEVPMD
jgi:hypothetical protein